MSQLAGWLSSNTATLSILGAAIAFVWSTAQHMAQRRAEADERQFQAFHKIVEKVVSPERNEGLVYIDRQAAVVSNSATFLDTSISRSACSRGLGRSGWLTQPLIRSC